MRLLLLLVLLSSGLIQNASAVTTQCALVYNLLPVGTKMLNTNGLETALVDGLNKIRAEEGRPQLKSTEIAHLQNMNRGTLQSWFLHELTLEKPHFRRADLFFVLGELRTTEALEPLMGDLTSHLKAKTTIPPTLVGALTKIGGRESVQKTALALLTANSSLYETLPMRERIKIQQLRGVFGDISVMDNLIFTAEGRLDQRDRPPNSDDIQRIQGEALYALATIGEPRGLDVVARRAASLELLKEMDFVQEYFLITSWKALSVAAYRHNHKASTDRLITLLSHAVWLNYTEASNHVNLYLAPKRSENTEGFQQEIRRRFLAGDRNVIYLYHFYPKERESLFKAAVSSVDYPHRELALTELLAPDINGHLDANLVEYAFYIAQTHITPLKTIALNALARRHHKWGPTFTSSRRFALNLMSLWHTQTDLGVRKQIQEMTWEFMSMKEANGDYTEFREELIMELADGRLTYQQLDSHGSESYSLKWVLQNENLVAPSEVRNFPDYRVKSQVDRARENLLGNMQRLLGLSSLTKPQQEALLAMYRVGAHQPGNSPYLLASADNVTMAQLAEKRRILTEAGLNADRILSRADIVAPYNSYYYSGIRIP